MKSLSNQQRLHQVNTEQLFENYRSALGHAVAYTYGAGASFDLPPGDYVAVVTLGAASVEVPFAAKVGERVEVTVPLNAGVAAFAFGDGNSFLEVLSASKDINGNRTSFGYSYGPTWQSTFPVDDVAGMEAVYGGRDGAVAKVRELLTETQAHWATVDTESELFGVTPLPYHWQGNEPSLHVCALPFELGDRALGLEYVEWVRTTQYNSSVAGVPGNDDGGATSAWLVEAMPGLHPIAGSDAWVLGQPLFPRVEIDVDGGVLEITRDDDASAGDVVTIDGVVVDGPRISHGELMGGGTLHFGAR